MISVYLSLYLFSTVRYLLNMFSEIGDDISLEDFRALFITTWYFSMWVWILLKLKKESRISKIVTNNKATVAVRFPKNKLTQKLLKILNYPLAAPSANISTNISPVSAKDVREEFGKKIKFILNDGSSKVGLESTIINLVKKPEILRHGGIEIEKISKTLKKKIKFKSKKNKISVPGQAKVHYSPHITMRLNVKKNIQIQLEK